MASNDPIASKARKPDLSIEDAERFASQIRPSWELLGPDAAAAGFGLDDAPGVAAPAPSAGSGGKAADTIIEGVPTVAIAGSDESLPVDSSWDDEPAAPVASAAPAPPIVAQAIKSIGVPSKAEVPVAELPLPPQVGHPMVPTAGAPIAPTPPAKTRVGMGNTSGEREAIARPKQGPASVKPASAKSAAVPASTRSPAPASGKAGASKSKPGTTNPGAAYVPAASEADDDIAIPISGAPRGLLLKIGGGVAAVAAILIAIKVLGGSGHPDPVKPSTTTTPTTTAATLAAPPPLDTTLADPPKPTAIATAAAAVPTVAATTAPTTAPTAKDKPVVARVEPPPPVTTAKKTPAAPPAGAGTPPAGPAKKKGGGIIRETPF